MKRKLNIQRASLGKITEKQMLRLGRAKKARSSFHWLEPKWNAQKFLRDTYFSQEILLS